MTLKNNIYKNIASILCSNKPEFRTAQNIVLFERVISIYPSKSIYCLLSSRIISFIEKNVFNTSLILEVMKDENEDSEIIENIEFLMNNPTITTTAEVSRLCRLLADYVKWAKILKLKKSFIKTLDMIDEDEDIGNMVEHVEALHKMSLEVIEAYNSVNISEVSNTFDTNDREGMKSVIAETKDARSADKVILTGFRGLNSLLSPGYLSGCVYVYAALPGNYKSGILLESHIDTCKYNEHIKNTTNGKQPISMYISMENTMSQTIRRLWGLLYPTADMSMYSVDEICDMIEKSLGEKDIRSVILYYGYREKSTADLGNIIRTFNDGEHEVVAVYLDYIKRIRPARTDAAVTSSEKSELHAIMNELKLLAAQFNIPIVTGHQLNREAARAVDNMIANGGYNKTSEALGRSAVSVAWEVMEVADFLALMNIENDGENKHLMLKAAKQRDLDSNTDTTITAIRHPFYSVQSFALRPDIYENCAISIPIYFGKMQTNFMANI